jgi:hypothetical protein
LDTDSQHLFGKNAVQRIQWQFSAVLFRQYRLDRPESGAVGRHALCWVHAERLSTRSARDVVHRLDTFTDPQRFDRIFRRCTGFATPDRLLKRLRANKAELLMVLERPDIPLHTNGSENDIRCQVIRRKVSAGTRSDAGRDCRDAFLGLAKTCARHGIAFWDYLGSRLGVHAQPAIPSLPELIRCRGLPA